MRPLNDEEFAKFADYGMTPEWSLTIEAWLATSSPYGEFGWDGIPVTYSSRTFSPFWDEEFEDMTPMDRDWWSCPIQCLHVAPLHLEILKDALPDYQWQLHEKWRADPRGDADTDDRVGHCEVVGIDPVTKEVVASCLNVEDIAGTLEACGYPNKEPVTTSEDILTCYQMASEKVKEAA